MKSKEGKILSMIALVAIMAIAPVTTVAFAQTTVDASSDTEIKVQNDEDGTSVSTSSKNEVSVNEDDTSSDTETDKQKRDEIRDSIKEQRKEARDEAKQIRDEKVKDIRERIAEQYKDRIGDSANTDVRQKPIADRVPDLEFRGVTDGYMIFGGVAYSSEIGLEGTAYHAQDNIWHVRADGKISVADREAKLELKGFARGNSLILHGNGVLDNGEKVRLFLRGHFAPTPETGVFALAFTHAGLHNVDTGERIPMMHVGKVKVAALSDIEPAKMFADTA